MHIEQGLLLYESNTKFNSDCELAVSVTLFFGFSDHAGLLEYEVLLGEQAALLLHSLNLDL